MYPKEFLYANKELEEPGFCFVLMPFDKEFGKVWETIRSTTESAEFNLECKRADDFSTPGYIMEDILRNICKASILVADLTNKNPNVFYELGIAHSVKNSSQVILLSQSLDFIPFDLRHLRCLIYKPDLSDLQLKLTAALRELGIKQYRLVLSERETQRFPSRLTGPDFCLYELEVTTPYIGADGAKVHMTLHQYVGSNPPQVVFDDVLLIGQQRPEFEIPKLTWKLCFGGIQDGRVGLVLRK